MVKLPCAFFFLFSQIENNRSHLRLYAANCAYNSFMWNKIYSFLLAVAVLGIGVFLYFQYSWLQSKTAPKDVVAQYEFYSNSSWLFLLFSALVLLIVGNVVLWKTGKAWAVWTSFLYFAGFMLAHTFWLENSFFRYKQANTADNNLISWSPLLGVVLIALAAIIVFFNQYLVKRMREKTLPDAGQPIESLPEATATDEKVVQ